MSRASIALLALLLAGCASPGLTGLPAPDAQVRVTEARAGASAGLIGGAEGQGDTCIVSVVGEPPVALVIEFAGTRCAMRYNGVVGDALRTE